MGLSDAALINSCLLFRHYCYIQMWFLAKHDFTHNFVSLPQDLCCYLNAAAYFVCPFLVSHRPPPVRVVMVAAAPASFRYYCPQRSQSRARADARAGRQRMRRGARAGGVRPRGGGVFTG